MNLAPLFEKQRELDELINEERGFDNKSIFKKVLALQVEIGELANEFPEVFKFWSNKRNNREKGLIEFIDCIHFLLGIGLDLGFHAEYKPSLSHEKRPLESFLILFERASCFHVHTGRANKFFWYAEVFDSCLALGKSLGFTWKEIEQAYMDKNKVNHDRQDSGY
jgi:dimeric dUTPase (all-alpha-NTP-PPase superfamily)